MKKSTLVSLALMVPLMGYSTDYFVSVNGAGSKDGSSWENAIDFASWYGKVNSYATGDVFYFAGGTYYAVSATPTVITNGYTFIGGFDPSLTGTSHTTPSYPSSTPTIFSGDVNQNSEQDAADASRFLAFQTATKDSSKPVVIQGIEFTNAFDATVDNKTHGALQLNNCGDVTVKNCRFYNNNTKATGYGGMALTSYRSTIYCLDSEFTNNSAVQRGGAIYVWVDGTDYSKGKTVLERCLIANNKVTDATSPLGSAICYTHGPALSIVNSTITGNVAPSGGAVYVNGSDKDWKRVTSIISSTIAGNIGGYQIMMTQGTTGAALHLANSIVVNADSNPAIYVSGTTSIAASGVLSGGYNILSYSQQATNALPSWQTSDWVSTANTQESLYAANAVADGPVAAPYGATREQLQSAVTDWAVSQDLTVDMTGTPRGTVSVPGAVVANPLTGNFSVNKDATDGTTCYATYYHSLGWYVPEGVEAGIITADGIGGTALTPNYKYPAGSLVPAQSAVIMKGTAGDYTPALKLEAATTDTDNLLRGAEVEGLTSSDSDNATFYKLTRDANGTANSVGFYWGAADGAAFTTAANKAYLALPAGSSAKAFLFNTTTGIHTVSPVQPTDAAVYTINGVRVMSKNLPAGLYIKQGKKVIIK